MILNNNHHGNNNLIMSGHILVFFLTRGVCNGVLERGSQFFVRSGGGRCAEHLP